VPSTLLREVQSGVFVRVDSDPEGLRRLLAGPANDSAHTVWLVGAARADALAVAAAYASRAPRAQVMAIVPTPLGESWMAFAKEVATVAGLASGRFGVVVVGDDADDIHTIDERSGWLFATYADEANDVVVVRPTVERANESVWSASRQTFAAFSSALDVGVAHALASNRDHTDVNASRGRFALRDAALTIVQRNAEFVCERTVCPVYQDEQFHIAVDNAL